MTSLRLSQQHLNLLSLCPRKFQYTYLDQLVAPTHPDQEERLAWGSRFHLLMQQHELGLPVDTLLTGDEELKHCYHDFLHAAADILMPQADQNQTIFREAEHQRTLNFGSDLLVVVYDLIIAETEQARILDWKTYPRPQTKKHLEKNWQTRLYPFVFIETTDYQPEQISMTYWFVKPSKKQSPQSLNFPYNQKKHQKTQKDLTHLINQLHQYLERYQQGEPFPQVDLNEDYCQSCQFAIRCQRVSESQPSISEPFNRVNLLNFDQIEEVKI